MRKQAGPSRSLRLQVAEAEYIASSGSEEEAQAAGGGVATGSLDSCQGLAEAWRADQAEEAGSEESYVEEERGY